MDVAGLIAAPITTDDCEDVVSFERRRDSGFAGQVSAAPDASATRHINC
jgi:hypothetical protein